MKKLSVLTSSFLFACLAAQTSVATTNNLTLHLKSPAIAGSGCLSGTTRHIVSGSGKTLSILVNYAADSIAKSCNIALPVTVPNGFQVAFSSGEFRGFVKGKATLKRSYFFAGERTGLKTSHLSSTKGRHYRVKDNLLHTAWSGCGKDVTMRVNSRVHAQNNTSSIRVGSSGRKKGIVVKLRYRRCQ